MKKQQSERGSVLKSLRREARVSQSKVSRATDLDAKTIWRLEEGLGATISRRAAEQMAKFYSMMLKRKILPDQLGYQIGRLKKEQKYTLADWARVNDHLYQLAYPAEEDVLLEEDEGLANLAGLEDHHGDDLGNSGCILRALATGPV